MELHLKQFLNQFVILYKAETPEEIRNTINKLTDEMLKYATDMEFEKAAELRDKIKELEKLLD